MRINVATRHGQLGAETKEKIRGKVEKLGRFHDRVSGIDVTVDVKDSDHPEVEIQVSVDGAKDFLARTTGGSLLGAVEGAVQKLELQLKKYKRKVIDQHRAGGHKHQPIPEVDTTTDSGE